jgi:hypothetical protein
MEAHQQVGREASNVLETVGTCASTKAATDRTRYKSLMSFKSITHYITAPSKIRPGHTSSLAYPNC